MSTTTSRSDFIEVGDRVVVPNRQWGIGSTSGIPVEDEFTWVYEIRDSQIARVDEYDTLEEALEAAGTVGARRSRRLLSLRDTARAMSQENVEIVRGAFETWQRRAR